MSYVITIRRNSPISPDELRSAIDGDSQFTIATGDVVVSDDILELAWCPDDAAKPEYFSLSNGAIDVTTPSNGALQRMQTLAHALDAEVTGEEGEDLTDVEVPGVEAGGCGPVVWSMLFMSVLLLGYWLAN